MSQTGAIVGTAAYMSPEQARGKVVDKRTDVWAFGAVLYEMLTGTRAFEGDDIAELIASVMRSTPNWAALPAGVPPHIVTLIQRCLDKDRKTRIGDIAVARFLLSGDAAIAAPTAGSSDAQPQPAAGLRARMLVPWIAAALVAGGIAGWLLPRRTVESRIVTQLEMGVQPADQLTPGQNARYRPSRTAIAISPDGRMAIFAGIHNGVAQLYQRSLDRADAAVLSGTIGGYAPFFSPDGAWIGFVADNKIKKMAAAGGPASAVCDLPPGQFWGASWGDEGTIVFAVRPGIFTVPASGGTPVQVTRLDLTRGDRHLTPQLLPGGRLLLYTAPPNIVVRPLDGGAEHTIVQDGADARYVRSGHLLYMKAGTLMAAPFDARGGRVTGPAVAMLENVMQSINAGNSNENALAGQFAVSDTGTLVYAAGGVFPPRLLTLVMVDRKGIVEPVPGSTPRLYLFPRLSHDGQRVAVETSDGERGLTDVWVYDIARGTPTRLTFDGGSRPVWSPDGKRIAYSHIVDGITNLFAINADGSGKPERLLSATVGQSPAAWAIGTNTIAFFQRPTTDTFGIWTLPMSGDARKASLWLESRFLLSHPDFSPDGRWIVYVSSESGGPEVYVQGIAGGGKTRVSVNGGIEPVWTANGREILFRSATIEHNPAFLSAAVRSTSPLQLDPPRVMFEAKPTDYDATTPVRAWDATADGQRFIMVRDAGPSDKPVTTLQVVLNWSDELKQR